MRDQYTDGYAQGYADHQEGFEYQPEEEDEDYLAGYGDGWDEFEEDQGDG
jgi:hypothetical protein